MSEVPENYSETRQFERELALARLQGHIELAVEKFAELGDRVSTLRGLLERLKPVICDEDLKKLRIMEERLRPLTEDDKK